MNNKYKICIHIARSNSFIGTISNVPFAGAPAGVFDEVKYTKQKITISAYRSKKFRTDEILKKKGNSLYNQILKSIVFLYLKNGERIRIIKITIDRSTTRTQDPTFEHDVDKYMQPLSDDFTLRFTIPDPIMNLVWREGRDYANLRSILTHFLCGLSSPDRYYIFERLWRAFEQLCLFHNRADRGNCDFKALAAMRTYIAGHLGDFPEALNEANKFSTLVFKKFDWEGYVKNEFPVMADGATRKMYENKFKVYFVTNNRDLRVVKMLEDIVSLRTAEMTHFGIDADVNSHITSYLALRERHDENVLTMICCKYAYYLRNKMFHGEIPDFTFTFAQGTDDDQRLDKINSLLELLCYELLLKYDRL